MSDISGSGSLQFWQGIAAVVGASVGGFFLAIGRRAGSVASRAPEAAPAGDALQREILAELRGLRADWQAKRERDEERTRDIRERNVDEQLDDLRRGQRLGRAGTTDLKLMLGSVLDRLPYSDRRSPRDLDGAEGH